MFQVTAGCFSFIPDPDTRITKPPAIIDPEGPEETTP